MFSHATMKRKRPILSLYVRRTQQAQEKETLFGKIVRSINITYSMKTVGSDFY